jgi:hypothetical protein
LKTFEITISPVVSAVQIIGADRIIYLIQAASNYSEKARPFLALLRNLITGFTQTIGCLQQTEQRLFQVRINKPEHGAEEPEM